MNFIISHINSDSKLILFRRNLIVVGYIAQSVAKVISTQVWGFELWFQNLCAQQFSCSFGYAEHRNRRNTRSPQVCMPHTVPNSKKTYLKQGGKWGPGGEVVLWSPQVCDYTHRNRSYTHNTYIIYIHMYTHRRMHNYAYITTQISHTYTYMQKFLESHLKVEET